MSYVEHNPNCAGCRAWRMAASLEHGDVHRLRQELGNLADAASRLQLALRATRLQLAALQAAAPTPEEST